MALLKIPEENRTIGDPTELVNYLAAVGIEYEQTAPAPAPSGQLSADDLLAAYDSTINELKARGGYVTADVIDVDSQTPGLESMLKRFSSEHWHDEDEVRL